MGGSRSHLDKNKKLENLPKIKFCVCTIRPCLAVHVAPRDVHACSILSRILDFVIVGTCIAVRLTKWHISLVLCYFLLYMVAVILFPVWGMGTHVV